VLTPQRCESTTTLALPALAPCDCTGHPASTGDFMVTVDTNGDDLSAAVGKGDCVKARTVRITAPAEVRGERFEWLAPASADPLAPLSTVITVPDTDDGVTVTARIGSQPCQRERSVTVKLCQTRSGFCASVRLPCQLVETTGVLAFLFVLICQHVGLSLVCGAVVNEAVQKAFAKWASRSWRARAPPVLSALRWPQRWSSRSRPMARRRRAWPR